MSDETKTAARQTRPGLLEAWLVLTSVKYHGNLYILIPFNQRLALTRLRATGPRSSLTRPQSPVFGSHTCPKGARGVMGRMKTKGRDECLILTRKVALGHFPYFLVTENCVSYG